MLPALQTWSRLRASHRAEKETIRSVSLDRHHRFRNFVGEQAALLIPGALFALALTLPAWRYYLLWHVRVEDIYFELHDGFVYLSDLPLLVAVGCWMLTPFPRRVGRLPRWLTGSLLLLVTWATVSILWAPLRSFAAYQAFRLWLLFLLYLTVGTVIEARAALVWGLVVSGAMQAALGIVQFVGQKTLGLRELGEITMRPEWSGASVITVGGEPVLRAYGLTQHPNLLGGFLMVTTLLGFGLVLSAAGARRWIAALLTVASFAGLLVTFSRGAWLGWAAGVLVGFALLVTGPRRAATNWKTAAALLGVLAVVGLLFVTTQWPLLRPRLGLAVEGVEIRSADERSGLEASAWTLIRENPLIGVGYGNFSWALWQRQPVAIRAYPIYQPVHRVPLLASAELGVPGAILWLVLAAGPWLSLWRRRKRWPEGNMAMGLAVGFAASIAALSVVGWFDFYPWFSPQGRMLAWICWALWAQTTPRMGLSGAG
jgi:putative inorganic carbon (HCO3(-)) transporter